MNKIIKVIARGLLYIMIFVISFLCLACVCGIYGMIVELKYEENHDGMYRGGYDIPYNHLEMLVRKSTLGALCPRCTMTFGITGVRVNCEDASGVIEYETLSMGRYPQQKTEGAPIEWLVIDEKCGRTLLLSKYYLDAVPYDNKLYNISWAESQLRKWLNDDFYHSAFNKDEQKAIKISLIESDMYTFYEWDEEASPSRMTEDKIFVLDPHEKLIYLTMTGNDYHSEPTEYAKKQAGSDIEAADWSRFGAVPNIACQKYWSSWPADSSWTEPGDYCLLDVSDPKEDDNYILYVRPAMWVDSGYVRKLKERQ